MSYEYKNSDIEGLGMIPNHWKIDRIKDLTTSIQGGDWGDDPESEKEGENIVVLRVADLDDIFFKFEDLTIRKIKRGSFANRSINERSLIIEKSGGGEKQLVGRVGYPMGINFPAVCSNFMAKLDFDNSIDIRFINYIFASLYNSRLNFPFVQQTTGIQNLNVTYYLCTKVAIPPIEEQNSIANYLDRTCSKIDQVISIKENQLQSIQLMRKSKIDELICFGSSSGQTKTQDTTLDYLPKIKDGWKLDRFKDVAMLRDEKTDEKSEQEDYIELEDLDQGTGLLIGKRNTLEVASKVTKFYKGDVLFGKLRPYLEKYHFADFDGKCTGEILAFNPTRINGKYLMYIIASKWFIDLCNSMSYGAKMPRVNWNTQLAKIYLPIPSPQEQTQIAEQLDELSKKVSNLSETIINQIEHLKDYRKSLIHECVTGKKQVAEISENNKLKTA